MGCEWPKVAMHAQLRAASLFSRMCMGTLIWVLASSVDAEWAFSSGHLQISHLQHNMNSQTFRAQMAVGSWAQSPLYPGFDKMVGIVKSEMGEECEEENIGVELGEEI